MAKQECKESVAITYAGEETIIYHISFSCDESTLYETASEDEKDQQIAEHKSDHEYEKEQHEK